MNRIGSERITRMSDEKSCQYHGFKYDENGDCPRCSANFWEYELEEGSNRNGK
jgi:hypothetical protein